jgi:hypothetical protein
VFEARRNIGSDDYLTAFWNKTCRGPCEQSAKEAPGTTGVCLNLVAGKSVIQHRAGLRQQLAKAGTGPWVLLLEDEMPGTLAAGMERPRKGPKHPKHSCDII